LIPSKAIGWASLGSWRALRSPYARPRHPAQDKRIVGGGLDFVANRLVGKRTCCGGFGHAQCLLTLLAPCQTHIGRAQVFCFIRTGLGIGQETNGRRSAVVAEGMGVCLWAAGVCHRSTDGCTGWEIAGRRILGATQSDSYFLAAGIYAPIGDGGVEFVGRAFSPPVFSN
jgi:hypothetical protein